MRRPRTIHEFHPGKIMENRFACWDPWIAASDVTDLYLATNTQLNKKGCTARLPQLPPRSPASYFDKATLHLGILDHWQAPLCLSKLQMDQLDKRIICSTNHFLSRETYCYLVFDIRNTLPSLGTRIRGLGRWDFPKDSPRWDEGNSKWSCYSNWGGILGEISPGECWSWSFSFPKI